MSIHIELSSEAQDAINHGVGLSFNCQLAIRRSMWLFHISEKQKLHRFFITRHALSSRYIVRRDDLLTPRLFSTISEATNYIAAQTIMLLEFYHDANNPYSMRLSLDKFKLPGPMRLNAFISGAWDLDTGWISR